MQALINRMNRIRIETVKTQAIILMSSYIISNRIIINPVGIAYKVILIGLIVTLAFIMPEREIKYGSMCLIGILLGA